jgi:hypothetical protein
MAVSRAGRGQRLRRGLARQERLRTSEGLTTSTPRSPQQPGPPGPSHANHAADARCSAPNDDSPEASARQRSPAPQPALRNPPTQSEQPRARLFTPSWRTTGEARAARHFKPERTACPVSPNVASVRLRLRVTLRASELPCESPPVVVVAGRWPRGIDKQPWSGPEPAGDLELVGRSAQRVDRVPWPPLPRAAGRVPGRRAWLGPSYWCLRRAGSSFFATVAVSTPAVVACVIRRSRHGSAGSCEG